MYCPNCGKIIDPNDKFCSYCGYVFGEKKKTNSKKWFGYVWTVIVNLITIGVVLGIYSNLYDDFEIIVVSLLILIYLSIQTFAMSSGSIAVGTAFSNYDEFARIRKLIQKNVGEDEDSEKEEYDEAKKKLSKAKIKMYINASFAFIIYVIALLNLFDAI